MINCYFKQFSSLTCKKSNRLIIDSFEFHPVRGEREKAILSQIFSDAALGNTQITSIMDITKTIKGSLGLIALSVGELELNDKTFPSVIIDYLFVDNRHRNLIYEHFGDKVSKMLLVYAIQAAMEISKLAGVRYLILRPDGGKEHKNLVSFYESMKFKYMTNKHEWMYLKLT